MIESETVRLNSVILTLSNIKGNKFEKTEKLLTAGDSAIAVSCIPTCERHSQQLALPSISCASSMARKSRCSVHSRKKKTISTGHTTLLSENFRDEINYVTLRFIDET